MKNMSMISLLMILLAGFPLLNGATKDSLGWSNSPNSKTSQPSTKEVQPIIGDAVSTVSDNNENIEPVIGDAVSTVSDNNENIEPVIGDAVSVVADEDKSNRSESTLARGMKEPLAKDGVQSQSGKATSLAPSEFTNWMPRSKVIPKDGETISSPIENVSNVGEGTVSSPINSDLPEFTNWMPTVKTPPVQILPKIPPVQSAKTDGKPGASEGYSPDQKNGTETNPNTLPSNQGYIKDIQLSNNGGTVFVSSDKGTTVNTVLNISKNTVIKERDKIVTANQLKKGMKISFKVPDIINAMYPPTFFTEEITILEK